MSLNIANLIVKITDTVFHIPPVLLASDSITVPCNSL